MAVIRFETMGKTTQITIDAVTRKPEKFLRVMRINVR